MRKKIMFERKKLISLICLLLTIVLGIGYAVLSEQLKVNGSVNYDTMAWDIGFSAAYDGGGTVSSNPEVSSDKKSISISCDLGTSLVQETCIAKAKIKNGSSFAVQLDESPLVEYDNIYINSVDVVWTDIDGRVKAFDEITTNSEREIKVTILTKELNADMLPENGLSLPITITMNWVEAGKTGGEVVQSLSGKKFSILSDSFSTYAGYSNDENANSTIKDNLGYFGIGVKEDISDVSQTWWMQAVNETGMELLVNNSSSASKTVGVQINDTENHQGYIRAENLHDDTGDNAGTNPDVIAILMGVNDYLHTTTLGTYSDNLIDTLVTENDDGTFSYAVPTTFAEGYFIMVHKIVNKYENADVYCFTILPNGVKSDQALLDGINNVIRNVASYFNVELVDLYNDSGIVESLNTYMGSTAGKNLHPNQAGMDLITQTFINKLKEKYVIE